MVDKITKLIEVKKLIALMVVSVLCGLAIKETVTAEAFTNIAVMIIGYYFGQSTVKGVK